MRIDDGHLPPDRRKVWQQGMTDLNLLLLTGRDRGQPRLLAVVDQDAIELRMIQAEVQQVQPAARERGIDNQQVKWLAGVVRQRQQLFQALHRCDPEIPHLIEPALDPQPVKVLFVRDQDT